MTIHLKGFHIDSLREATNLLTAEDIAPYVQLRRLLPELNQLDARNNFQKIFANYYGLGQARVDDEFREAFFRILYQYLQRMPDEPYGEPLVDLFNLPNKGGKLHWSFVSKLVSTVDETRPIWDRHVRSFLGVAVEQGGSVPNRIAGFLALIDLVRASYEEWLADPVVEQCVTTARGLHNDLNDVSPIRILDLLIWNYGRNHPMAPNGG